MTVSSGLGGESMSFLGSELELSMEQLQRAGAASIVRSLINYSSEGHGLPGIELFAGSAGWVTETIMAGCEPLSLVEYSSDKCSLLESKFPGSDVVCCDVIADFPKVAARVASSSVISMDNPSAIFGTEGQYCEHFDVLPLVLNVDSTLQRVVVLNLNIRPFGMSKISGWSERRDEFYGSTNDWGLTEYIDFYRCLCQNFGWHVREISSIPRRGTFLQFLVLFLERTS